MRQVNTSQEYSRDYTRRKTGAIDNDSQSNYEEDDNSINCPLIFKTFMVSLLTLGILAFIISFAIITRDSTDLSSSDFTSCPDSKNVRRLVKSYAYEKIVLGLSISAVVISFGLVMFLLRYAYDYCRCFDGCYDDISEGSQQQSSVQQVDMNRYELQLKKRIKQNILIPKSQISHHQSNQIVPQKIKRQQSPKSPHVTFKNNHTRKYLKKKEEIRQLDEEYERYVRSSPSDQSCECECEDCASCVAYCVGCLWCRTCFEAHHYHFYHSKAQQNFYWISYMIKTLLFGAAMAYVIRIYVSLKEIDYCESANAQDYAKNIEIPMIIGIITMVIDIFGYLHMFIQGTLLDIVEETIEDKRKSQHSDSESDEEAYDSQQYKKSNKYKESSSPTRKDKQDSKHKKSLPNLQQTPQQVELQTKQNLFASLKNPKHGLKNQIERQKQPESRDTDSFFIKLKTLGNRYLDNIEDQTDQNGTKQKATKKSKIEQQESYQNPDRKPNIQVPESIDDLPTKTFTKMRREQPEDS